MATTSTSRCPPALGGRPTSTPSSGWWCRRWTRFAPQLIVVASGLDANWTDPGGRMNLTPECFRRLTATLMDAADRLCDGRLVLLHEGGYSTLAVPYCGLAVLEALTGHLTGVPFDAAADGDPAARPLHQHERDAVDAGRE